MKTSHQSRLGRLAAQLALCTLPFPSLAATIAAGSGANVPTTATGIYEIVVTTSQQAAYRTLALMHQGAIVEVHTRRDNAYLSRDAKSPAIKLSPARFTQLLSIAGGVNRDVNTMPAATRASFYAAANLQGSGAANPPPSQLPPANGACPTGYELRLVPDGSGRKALKCVLLTHRQDAPSSTETRLAAALRGLLRAPLELLVPAAEARLAEIRRKVRVGPFTVSVTVTEDIGELTAIALEISGATVTWVDVDGVTGGG